MKTETTLIIKKVIIGLGIALMIGWNINCFGQDTILKNNGTSINGKIMEISATEVRYKKAENPDGPVYIENRSDLSSISYSNGLKDTFKFEKPWLVPTSIKSEEVNPAPKNKSTELHKIGGRYTFNGAIINEREMRDYLSDLHDPAISEHLRMARLQKGFQYIGFAAIPLGIGSLFYLMQGSYLFGNNEETRVRSQNSAKLLGVAGIACIGTSICLKFKSKQHNAAAVKIYKQKY
jgi:hypothetical protein